MRLRTTLVLAGGALLALPTLGSGLSSEDVAAVRAASRAYVEAWLAQDPEAVMATLSEDAVLVPHHGVPPVVGAAAIREFWFPPQSPPTTVTRMVNEITEVLGDGDLAVVWGRSELEFVYDGTTYRNQGNYLNVLTRGEDGGWRIARRIWNDPLPETD